VPISVPSYTHGSAGSTGAGSASSSALSPAPTLFDD
jgi:hypothetical protein